MALGLAPQQIVDKDTHPLLRIHKDWKRIPLVEVASVQNGFAFKSKFFNREKGLPLIRIRDIQSAETENLYNGEYDEAFIVTLGEILIGMDGDFKVSKWPGERGLLNQRVCRLTFKSDIFDKGFFFLCLQPYLNAIHEETSSVTVKHLSSRTLKAIPLPLPPLPEQRAIVAKLEQLFSELDSGIADMQGAQAKLKVYRQAVLKKAFEGGLNGSCAVVETKVNSVKARIPNSWNIVRFGSLVHLQGGFAFKSKEYVQEGIPIVKIKNVHYERIDWSAKTFIASNRMAEFKDYQLEKDDVLIAMTRPFIKSQNTIKTVVVSAEDLPALLNQRVGRFKIKGDLIKEYLKYFLFTDFFKRRVIKESSSSQQPNISSRKIEEFDFILPKTVDEQNQIVQEIESRLSVCDKLEESITTNLQKAEALRQSILKKAFEGRLLSAAELAACKKEEDWCPAWELVGKIKDRSRTTV